MKVAILSVAFAALIVGICGHSYLVSPVPREPNTAHTDSTAVCDNKPIIYNNNVTVQAGRGITMNWALNQHSGTADVQFYCGPASVNPSLNPNATGGYQLWADMNGNKLFDFSSTTARIVVPTSTTPGEYTCVWYWFGPWYSCVDMKVIANDGTFQCQSNSDCHYVPPKSLVLGAGPGQGGNCNLATGVCTCFPGYSGKDCSTYSGSSSGTILQISAILSLLLVFIAY